MIACGGAFSANIVRRVEREWTDRRLGFAHQDLEALQDRAGLNGEMKFDGI